MLILYQQSIHINGQNIISSVDTQAAGLLRILFFRKPSDPKPNRFSRTTGPTERRLGVAVILLRTSQSVRRLNLGMYMTLYTVHARSPGVLTQVHANDSCRSQLTARFLRSRRRMRRSPLASHRMER